MEELFSSLDTELAVLPAEGRVMEAEWVDSLAAHPGVAWAGGVLEQDVVVRRQGEPVVAPLLGFDVDHAASNRCCPVGCGEGRALRADTLGAPCGYVGLGVASQLRIPFGRCAVHPDGQRPKRGRQLSRTADGLLDGGVDRLLVSGTLSVCGTFSVNADIDARHIIAPSALPKRCSNGRGKCPGSKWSLPQLEWEELRSPSMRVGRKPVDPHPPGKERPDPFDEPRREMGHVCHPQLHSDRGGLQHPRRLDHAPARQAARHRHPVGHRDDPEGHPPGLQLARVPHQRRGRRRRTRLGPHPRLAAGSYGLVRLEGAMVPAYPVALRAGDVLGVLLVVLGVGGTFSAAMVAYLVRRMAPDAA